jgi:hypothetical protein
VKNNLSLFIVGVIALSLAPLAIAALHAKYSKRQSA